MRPPSWLPSRSELLRTTVLYLAVGAIFLPLAVVYASFPVLRSGGSTSLLLVLAIGFVLAHVLWQRVETRLAQVGVRVLATSTASASVAPPIAAVATPAVRYAFVAVLTVVAVREPVRTESLAQSPATSSHVRLLPASKF